MLLGCGLCVSTMAGFHLSLMAANDGASSCPLLLSTSNRHVQEQTTGRQFIKVDIYISMICFLKQHIQGGGSAPVLVCVNH